MTVICPTFLLESGTFFREYLLLLQFDDFLYLFFKVWSKDFYNPQNEAFRLF